MDERREPDSPVPSAMWDRMTSEGHAAFALASATNGVELRDERERQLVETAVVAGVVGALEVLRHDEDADCEGDE